MPLTLDPPMPAVHQIPAAKPDLTRFHIKRLRSALLEVSGALRCRPEPRDMWDDLGRGDAEQRSIWIDKDVLLCRMAMRAAEKEGPAIQEATRQRVKRYFAEKCAAALFGFEEHASDDLAQELVKMTREASEVLVAGAQAAAEPTISHLERLRDDGLEAIAELHDVVELASARLARERQHCTRFAAPKNGNRRGP
jgi:hypothetical protein